MKADQWHSQILILFVALFAAWQVDGKIPNKDAATSSSNTKNAAAQVQTNTLLHAQLIESLLAWNPNPSDEQIAKVQCTTTDWNLHHHYNSLLDFSVSLCILPSWSISQNEVVRGCRFLSWAVQSWAHMNCHLVPYHHLLMYFEDQFLWLGPNPGWWAYGSECNNGILGWTNHSNHIGGELEATMMQRWWKTTFIQDLVSTGSAHNCIKY